MKLLIASFLLVASINVQSQETIYAELPVRNGFILPNEFPKFKSSESSLRIASKNDSCFATEDGIISTTFKLENEHALLLKTPENKYIVYSNLMNKAVDRKTVVRKGTFLGLLKQEKEYYTLVFMLSDSTGKPFSTDEHRTYLGLNASR
jgi:hypothetical protein